MHTATKSIPIVLMACFCLGSPLNRLESKKNRYPLHKYSFSEYPPVPQTLEAPSGGDTSDAIDNSDMGRFFADRSFSDDTTNTHDRNNKHYFNFESFQNNSDDEESHYYARNSNHGKYNKNNNSDSKEARLLEKRHEHGKVSNVGYHKSQKSQKQQHPRTQTRTQTRTRTHRNKSHNDKSRPKNRKIVYIPATKNKDTAQYTVSQGLSSNSNSKYNGYTKSSSNDGKDQMLYLVNNLRAKYGKPPLTINPGLMAAALFHSRYQYSIKKITHENSIYPGLLRRYKVFGVHCTAGGENVARGQGSISQVFNDWVHSPGHFQNMVGDYKYFGYANVNRYWTQSFSG
ncbi:hypothetical protein AX774_g1730 [Zancudomyces culisetae]|uniref:SCP domain-containing protein n=1 Tax=Zancudomyces culisetae TaxID=1213189 RepID=A0A1R1PUS8_ZANCU|nr:hypothetical protein AX774_g1730 [Zancudomyces culisetae]|eukprot:OMH84740.1 hypothetical protein AX774_g1730 [Zancudomyces culisetae]